MTRSKLRALLYLVCAALCTGLLASCGESEQKAGSTAAGVLDETLAATSRIESGRLTGRLQLDPDGLLSLGGPIVLSASGPFAAPAAGEGPRFDLKMAAAIAGGAFEAGVRSTGRRAFLRLDGRDYALAGHGSRASERSGAPRAPGPRGAPRAPGPQGAPRAPGPSGAPGPRGAPRAPGPSGAPGPRGAPRAPGPHGALGALGALGLDPTAWIKNPQSEGNVTIAGVDTVRIAGDLDVERLLADVATLLDGGGQAGPGLLTPKLRAQLAEAVKSAKVEIYSGARDRILRQLTAAIDFTFPDGAARPITGLDGGRINVRLRLDDVDATTFEVATPKRARPLSELIGDGGLDALLSGVGASFGGAPGTGDGGAAFLRCVTAAGGRSAEIMRCASKLAP